MAEYSVKVGGEPIEINLEDSSLHCHYGVNQIPQLTLRIKDMDIKKGIVADDTVNDGDKKQPFKMGAKIEITTELADDKEVVIFSGLITERAIFRDGGTFLEVIAHGDVIKLTEGPRNFLLDKEVNDFKIIEAMYKAADLDTKGITKPALEAMIQPHYFAYQQTPWRVMMNRILANGLLLVPTPKGNNVVDLTKQEPKAEEIQIAQSDIEGFRLHQDIRSQFETVTVSAWDVKQQKMSAPQEGSGDVVKNEVGEKNNGLQLVPKVLLLQQGVLASEKENKARADAELIYRKLDRYRGKVTLVKHRLKKKVQLLDSLKLSEFGEAYSGTYRVTAIEHDFNGQKWSITFTLGLHLHHSLFSDWLTLPPVPNLIGVVRDFPKEKENPKEPGLQHIPVGIAAVAKSKMVWARLLSPYAGKEVGLFFPPSPGDEVIVSFVGGDCRYPVIIGATHNPKNKPPVPFKEGKLKRGVYLKHSEKKEKEKKAKEVSYASLVFDVENADLCLKVEKVKGGQTTMKIGGGTKGFVLEAKDKDKKSQAGLSIDKGLILQGDEKNSITLAKDIDIKTNGNVNIKVGKKVEIK
ncbi:phage baseplate assembly protein V [Shewanella surugensis]|uniref:Phage baseplate assembly protein V n=1 Tax=Shewanella surugensis TaxID=212020 RepID=A0ABT0L690_9GAMM|nr:phage baseplate assembly protein V [Shewanella surugensis]MCL1123203.1 phage baseplate assembly protein V [Shewanella surugensis]